MRTLIMAAACAILASAALAQGDEQMSHDEMMKAYEAAAKPGPEHAMLAKLAGRWKCTVKSWMDPKGEPQVSEGTESAEMIFGGRYLRTHFQGSMMGQPYEGMGTMGYDNGSRKFVGNWFDSMGTGILNYEGDYIAQSRELVCHGSYVDPVTGKKTTCRLVSRFAGDDLHVFEFWGPDPTGQEVRWMEMTYNRAR